MPPSRTVVPAMSSTASRINPTPSIVCSATVGARRHPSAAESRDDDDPGVRDHPDARAVVGGLRVDPGPTPHHGRKRHTEDRLGSGPQVLVRLLLDGEVVRLVVVVGVTDRQATRRPLRDEELRVVARDDPRRRREQRGEGTSTAGSTAASRRRRAPS